MGPCYRGRAPDCAPVSPTFARGATFPVGWRGPRQLGTSWLDLPPGRRPPPRPVAAGQVLGHHALLSLGHQSCEEGLPRTNHSLREEQYRLVQALYQFLQSSTPFPQGLAQQRVAPVIEQIENHIANRLAVTGPVDARRAG